MDAIIPEDELSKLVQEGAKILTHDRNYSENERRVFCNVLCQNIINQFDSKLIIQQFSAPDFTNAAFTDALSHSIEIGVISFMLKYI